MNAAIHTLPRQPSIPSASADFFEACAERHGQSASRDEAALYRIAGLIAKTLILMETEVGSLDMARETVDRTGFALRAKPFVAARVDIVALYQVLFNDCPLTDEAENLLVLMVEEQLQGGVL